MAFDPNPDQWFPTGYAYASNAVTFNTAAHASPLLTQLTAAEADAATGDVREVIRSLCHMWQEKWDAKAAADLPTKMRLSKSIRYDSSGVATETYVLNFTVGVSYGNLTAE